MVPGSLTGDPKLFAQEWVNIYQKVKKRSFRTPWNRSLTPKPIGEALVRASTLTREHEIVRVNKTAKIGMFKQPLWEEVVFPLPECLMRTANVSDWGTLPLPSITKPKPVDKNLMEAPARYVRVDGIKADGIQLVGELVCLSRM